MLRRTDTEVNLKADSWACSDLPGVLAGVLVTSGSDSWQVAGSYFEACNCAASRDHRPEPRT